MMIDRSRCDDDDGWMMLIRWAVMLIVGCESTGIVGVDDDDIDV